MLNFNQFKFFVDTTLKTTNNPSQPEDKYISTYSNPVPIQ